MSFPTIFLDRDGTINEEVHYLSEPARLRLIPGAGDAIRTLRAAGYRIVVVTNQSGIARGFFTPDTLDAIHHKLRSELHLHHAELDGIYACVHHPDDGCTCRKPGSQLYLQAARDLDLDLSRSLMIGDKDTDLLAGKNLSMPSILVRTGFGLSHQAGIAQWRDYQPAYIADDLGDATRWLLVNFNQPA